MKPRHSPLRLGAALAVLVGLGFAVAWVGSLAGAFLALIGVSAGLALAVLLDVLGVRRARDALQESLEREQLRHVRTREYVQRLINVIPQPVYVKDAESRYLLVNDAFCAERGRSREQLAGQNSWGLAADRQLSSSIAGEDARVLAGETISKEECLPHMYSGEERFRLITKGSCLDADGQPVIVGANFDITPWRQAERAASQAAERERRLRERTQDYIQRLIDVIPEPVYVKDAHSRYVMVNDAFARDFEVNKDAIPGLDSIVRVGEGLDDAGAAIRGEDLAVLAGERIFKEEHRPYLVTGAERHRVVSKAACENAEGEPVIVVASFDITRWHRAEQALKEALARETALRERTQAFIQRLIDVIPHPVYVKDADSHLLMVNQALADYHGCAPEALLGEPSYLAYREDAAAVQEVRAEDEAVLAGCPVIKEVRSVQSHTGQQLDRVIAKGACLDAEGRAVIVGTHIDITPWRNAERELQAALERETARRERTQVFIQRVIDLIPQPVAVKDANSRYLMVNGAHARELGVLPEELIGLRSYEWIIDRLPELVAAVVAEDAEVLAGKVIFREEHEPNELTGEERHRVISKASCLDAEGRPVIVVANYNVTRWYQAERELTEALDRERERAERIRQFVQRLIDVIPQPVYVKDANSRYLMVNRAFAEDRGRPPAELVGAESSVRPEVRTRVYAEDAAVLAGATVFKEESGPHFRTGELRYRVISKGFCLDAEGKPVVVGANFDVTPWRLAEGRLFAAKEAAERANAAKTSFLTNMSHELRTPMHGILSFARIGAQRAGDTSPERLATYFQRIVASAERLMGLLDDLLDLSKLEAGRMEIEPAVLDIVPLIHEGVAEFEGMLHARHQRLHMEAIGCEMLRGDAKLIGQLLRNLISNAIKFSPDGGEISVTVQSAVLGLEPRPQRAAIEVVVADRGPGIPEDELEMVFDKFMQSSKTRSGAGGTGLGLAICREIASVHEGLIFARNRSGGGAELVLRLPVEGPAG